MAPKLRYEFYLPTYYNDGTPIEQSKYRVVKDKIVKEFGTVSVHPATVQGIWVNKENNTTDYDNCSRFEISVEKIDKNEEFFENLKQV